MTTRIQACYGIEDQEHRCDLCCVPSIQNLCPECFDRAEQYQQRVDARIEEIKARAIRARERAERDLETARQKASVIPFGQPVLVGHHSERRDRNYRRGIERTYRRGFKGLKEADDLERKAQSNSAISSDDPLAALKLREKVDRAQASQARMKAANKIVRKWSKKDPAECRRLLAEIEFATEQIDKLLTPDFAGRVGFPGYALRNNGAHIRRMKQRIEELEASEGPYIARDVPPGVQVVEADNRLRLIFEGKPSPQIHNVLKRNGWRWSPRNAAWQRFLNANSREALQRTLKAIEEIGSKT